MNAHLDIERLTYLVYGMMDPAEKKQAGAHLSECADCSKAVRVLEGERRMIVEATEAPEAPEGLVGRVVEIVNGKTSTALRSRRNRAWLVVSSCAAGALLVIGLAMALTGGREPEERPANNKVVQKPGKPAAVNAGRVSVQRAGAWVEQTTGYVPGQGERLRTSDAAGATLGLGEGSQFKIRQGSEIEFQGVRGPKPVLRVLEGEVHCNVVADPQPCSIEVGSSTVTVVGTEFVVQVLEDQAAFVPEERLPRSPRVSLRVISGSVEFRAGASDLRVTPGWIALAGADGPPWIWGKEKELRTEIDKAFEEMFKKGFDLKVVMTTEEPWRNRSDEAVQASVDAVPWKNLAGAVLWDEKERDASVREQRKARTMPPDLRGDFGLGWGRVQKLAGELRVGGDFKRACRNNLASVRFVEAMAEALAGSPLTEEQRLLLKSSEIVEDLIPILDPAAPPLAKWKAQGERILHTAEYLKEALTEDQYRHLALCVGPAFFVEDYRTWVIDAPSGEDAAEKVARIWMDNFKLPPFVQAPLAWIADDFVRGHLESSRDFRRRHGAALTPLQELELSNRHLENQIRAEGRVSQVPSLGEVTKKRALAGSKALFKVRIAEGK